VALEEAVEDVALAAAGLEDVESEQIDEEASLRAYEILTYPADYTLEVLVEKYRKEQVLVPRFQRKYVWSQAQASKLIESFLLGLPVPAIFLYSEPETNNLLVVDGQQRLKTVSYFFEGYFGDEFKGARSVFRLSGLDESSPYNGLTYADLANRNEPAFNKLNDSVLRAFVIKQLDPADDTSIYHVFERLNTGGTLLLPQEIRNAIHHGPFNDLLIELNTNAAWRSVFGRNAPEKRQRDVELILRFFALMYAQAEYEKPMKDFLNKFMKNHQAADEAERTAYASLFQRTSERVVGELGERPFHIRAGLNAAVFDAVYVAVGRHIEEVAPGDLRARFDALIADGEFLEWVSTATTDKDTVISRLQRAEAVLFG
jgi:hypothetical protein